MKIAISYGTFHTKEVQKMLNEARRVAAEQNLEIVAEVGVPGSVEKPLAIKKLLKREDVDAVVVLGIIEKGGTKHGYTMGQSLMHHVMQLSIDFEKPVGMGVLGPDIDPEQIDPRLLPYAEKAVQAVAHMLSLK